MFENLCRGKTMPNSQGELNGVWIEGDLIHSSDKYYIHPVANAVTVEGELGKVIVMHEIDPSTRGMYTGLTDKDGKKIFEGDIVSYNFWPDGSHAIISDAGCIYYDNSRFYFHSIKCGWGMFDIVPLDHFMSHLNRNEIRVIGNIYDDDTEDFEI